MCVWLWQDNVELFYYSLWLIRHLPSARLLATCLVLMMSVIDVWYSVACFYWNVFDCLHLYFIIVQHNIQGQSYVPFVCNTQCTRKHWRKKKLRPSVMRHCWVCSICIHVSVFTAISKLEISFSLKMVQSSWVCNIILTCWYVFAFRVI